MRFALATSHAPPNMLFPTCSSQHAPPNMLFPTCSSQHALPNMLLPTCSSQHAPPNMFLPTCSSQHAPPNMLLPTCSSQHALPNMLLPTCSSTLLLCIFNLLIVMVNIFKHLKNKYNFFIFYELHGTLVLHTLTLEDDYITMFKITEIIQITEIQT